MNTKHHKILFIVNKHAGSGHAKEFEQLIDSVCTRNQCGYKIEYTQHRTHGTTLASLAAKEQSFDCVVAVGGDGTINEVAMGLLNSGISMGIVPRGSGNGLARHLGIPLRTSDAVASLFASRELDMDIFRVNGKLSLNVSGIGFDGHVTNLFGVKSSRGLIGYVTVTVQEFFRFQEFSVEIIADGDTKTRSAFIIAIANSSQYGNNAVIAPRASVCDGLLHVTILKKVPLYRLDFLQAFFSGDLEKSSFSETIEGKVFSFKTNIPVSYHVDGEPCGLADTFDVELFPAALSILLPIDASRRNNI